MAYECDLDAVLAYAIDDAVGSREDLADPWIRVSVLTYLDPKIIDP